MNTTPLGVWIFGARGSVAATTIAGAAAMARGVADQSGLVTALPAFAGVPLAAPGDLVFGGHEVRGGTLAEEADALEAAGGLPRAVVAAARETLAAADARIRPGTLLGSGAGVRRLAGSGAAAPVRNAAEALDVVRVDLRTFKSTIPGGRVVAVNLCSTDGQRTPAAALADPESLARHIAAGGEVSPAVLYTYAALLEDYPFLNFTPLEGTETPALGALAASRRLPHAGKDGKTGETLLKSVLAPLFRDRNLPVLSWTGVNLLGNRDGDALRDPAANAAKVADKDHVVRDVLSAHPPETLTRIDYVRSLGDWKTAWDLVHFAGFCGVRMSLQLTWQGCDSILAAPLVLDLVRLLDLARRRGESGPLPHTAAFFKSPITGGPADFARQMEALTAYAAALAGRPRATPASA